MALVYVDTGESGCSLQVLVLLKGYMLLGELILVILSKPKVNNIDLILVLPFPQHEVTRFYIIMQEILRVDKLYPVD